MKRLLGVVLALVLGGTAKAQGLCQINGQDCALANLMANLPAMIQAQAPVQSVNAQTGAVTIPNSIRAECSVTSFDSSGNGTCHLINYSGGASFSSTPSCSGAPNIVPGYVYSAVEVGNSATDPTVQVRAASNSLSVLSLSVIAVWQQPPTGTAVSVVCRGS